MAPKLRFALCLPVFALVACAVPALPPTTDVPVGVAGAVNAAARGELFGVATAPIISGGAGNVISTNAGAIVSGGGGNIVSGGGGNIVSGGGGNIISGGAGNYALQADLNRMITAGAIISGGGGNIVSGGGGNIISGGAGNLVAGPGNYRTLSLPDDLTELPLSGAMVFARDARTMAVLTDVTPVRTDLQGHYRLTNLPLDVNVLVEVVWVGKDDQALHVLGFGRGLSAAAATPSPTNLATTLVAMQLIVASGEEKPQIYLMPDTTLNTMSATMDASLATHPAAKRQIAEAVTMKVAADGPVELPGDYNLPDFKGLIAASDEVVKADPALKAENDKAVAETMTRALSEVEQQTVVRPSAAPRPSSAGTATSTVTNAAGAVTNTTGVVTNGAGTVAGAGGVVGTTVGAVTNVGDGVGSTVGAVTNTVASTLPITAPLASTVAALPSVLPSLDPVTVVGGVTAPVASLLPITAPIASTVAALPSILPSVGLPNLLATPKPTPTPRPVATATPTPTPKIKLPIIGGLI